MLICHIQGIVPVCTPEADNVVFTHFIEGSQVFYQNMLQDRTLVNAVIFCTLLIAVAIAPLRINLSAPEGQRIFEIGHLFQKHIQIACLIHVKLGGKVGPESMVHPDTADSVAVGDKFTGLMSNNGGIGAINADAAIIAHNHTPHIAGIHQQQAQAILPEVTPTTASPAIVMVG